MRLIGLSVLVASAHGAGLAAAEPPQRPRFTDVAEESGIGFRHSFGARKLDNILMTTGSGAALLDYDSDGWLDALLLNGTPLDSGGRVVPTGALSDALFRNDHGSAFALVTTAAGLSRASYSMGVATADFDGDGLVDLYLTNYGANTLYRNLGDGTFEEMPGALGAAGSQWSTGASFFDYDGDGDLDLYVANDSTPNFLYRNDAGEFTEIGLRSGLAFDPQGVETGAMGVDVADVDGDGLQDLYVTNYVFEFNNLYRNRGALRFEDTTESLGLDKDNYRHVGWATRFADFNNDGRLDCFVANGHVSDYVEGLSGSVTYGQRNMMFLGDDKGRFEDVSSKVGDVFKSRRVSRGAAFGDYDNDGDIDILLSNSGGRAQLLRNDLDRGSPGQPIT